jgi:hypothetical protein
MTQYNAKLTTEGKYTPFHSWGVLSLVKTDLKFIENFIKYNNILNKYFSALPSTSYHLTVYSLWYNGIPLTNHQKRIINLNYSPEQCKKLEDQSKNIGYFNPKNCLDELLYKSYVECQQHKFDEIKLPIKNIYRHQQIGIPFQFTFFNNLRNNLIKICDNDDKAGTPHITLAYLYKNIPPEMEQLISNEINLLNKLLEGQTLLLHEPTVYYGSDMITWYPFMDYINNIAYKQTE